MIDENNYLTTKYTNVYVLCNVAKSLSLKNMTSMVGGKSIILWATFYICFVTGHQTEKIFCI